MANDLLRGRQTVASLTNKSGGGVVEGDVVILSDSTSKSFTTIASEGQTADWVGVALETIADSAVGRVILFGYAPKVNLDSAALLGDYITTDSVAKQATPVSATAAGVFGQVLETGTTPAAIIWCRPEQGTDALWGYLDGMSVERQVLTVVVSGTSVYLDIESTEGGDINYWVNGVKRTLDCTTGDGVGGKARVLLPQGTATAPIRSIVYVVWDEQESELTLATTLINPTGAFTPVAIMTIQDYTSVTANGALGFQRTTECVQHNEKGAISWMREKLRAMGAIYWEGLDQSVDITTNGGSEDDIDFTVTSGVVFQLHRQVFPNYSISSDDIYVANASGDGTLTNYQKLTDLNSIHEIEDGTALISGDSINLVIWGSINYDGESKLFVNLPSAKYTVDADATADVDNTAKTTIPNEFKTTGFLIAKLVLKYTSADNGTWENLLVQSIETWHTEDVIEWATPDYPALYPNDSDLELAELLYSGAEKIRVVFDAFNTEANYDFVTIRNGTDAFPINDAERRADPYSYNGNLGPFTSATVDGATMKVRFWSDGSVRRKGVSSDRFEYMTSASSGNEVIDLRGIPVGFNIRA